MARRVGMRMMHSKLFLGRAANQALFAENFYYTGISISRVDAVDGQVRWLYPGMMKILRSATSTRESGPGISGWKCRFLVLGCHSRLCPSSTRPKHARLP